ncbi:MAG: DUF2127 domain-containing protein [Blastocatellia bacterium]
MDRIKRPPSVWITQIIIPLFLIPFLFSGLSPIVRCLLSSDSKCLSLETLLRAIFVFGGISTISFFTFWGLLRRKRYGKWLGVLSLALLLCLLLMGEQSRVIYNYILSGGHVKRAMPTGYHDFSNDAQLIGAATFTVLLHLSLLFLIFRLAFAKPAKRFFHNGELLRSQVVKKYNERFDLSFSKDGSA